MIQAQATQENAYENILNNISLILNSKGHISINDFKDNLRALNRRISTKFLRSLMTNDGRKTTNRIRYLLSKADLKTSKENRFFKSWIFEKYSVDVVEYEHKKGVVYSSPCEMTQEEQQRVKEINEIEQATGLKLSYHLEDFKSRENLRQAINKADAVYLKEIRTQKISKAYRKNLKEVLYMIDFNSSGTTKKNKKDLTLLTNRKKKIEQGLIDEDAEELKI